MKCVMFVPPSSVFESCVRDIDPVDDIEINMTDGSPVYASHPGGKMLFLKELDKSGGHHYPINFSCPSIVTASPEDLKEMAIDIKSPTDSADWPGMDIVVSCPVCRSKVNPDGITE